MAGHKPGSPFGGISRSGSGFLCRLCTVLCGFLCLFGILPFLFPFLLYAGERIAGKLRVFGGHFLKVGVCPGVPFFTFPFCHAPGRVLPVTAFRIAGQHPGPALGGKF